MKSRGGWPSSAEYCVTENVWNVALWFCCSECLAWFRRRGAVRGTLVRYGLIEEFQSLSGKILLSHTQVDLVQRETAWLIVMRLYVCDGATRIVFRGSTGSVVEVCKAVHPP